MTVTVTDKDFDSQIKNSSVPVLVDFWAAWCGPCRMVSPVLEEIAAEREGKMVLAKLNVDENPQTAMKFGVMSIPTMIIFKNGQATKQLVGFQPKESLAKALDEALTA